MKKIVLVFAALIFLGSFSGNNSFLSEQQKYQRVREALKSKQADVDANLSGFQIKVDLLNILIVCYKDINLLELYGKNIHDSTFRLINTYPVCARSGRLGPKQRQGDGQVPEGFYYINRFNPFSNFYLSLGISYPNLSDKRRSRFSNLGGDIFIHGSCVTIGCLPMTDDKIKEIYLYAVYARSNGQIKIPVYIFPSKMDKSGVEKLMTVGKSNPELLAFWKNLKEGYDLFTRDKKELTVKVLENGDYHFDLMK